jgi:hypothetical protein
MKGNMRNLIPLKSKKKFTISDETKAQLAFISLVVFPLLISFCLAGIAYFLVGAL